MPKWVDLLKQLAPIVIATTVPGGELIAPIVTAAIGEAEHIPGASGAEKKAHVVAITRDTVASINAGAKKEILDPVVVPETVGHAIDTAIGVTNIVHRAHGAGV